MATRPPSIITPDELQRPEHSDLDINLRNIYGFWELYKNNARVRDILRGLLPEANRDNNNKVKELFFAHHDRPEIRAHLYEELDRRAKLDNNRRRRKRKRLLDPLELPARSWPNRKRS